MSDFGATDQFSLQRFDNPLTTSALFPINRSRPMTFLRHVPILRERGGEQKRFGAVSAEEGGNP